ncbi:hypothetical protein BXY85_1619 [Roseivirga pacifica]|uniref:Uncharacterized protein n=1 Tax=Roseivirga pacifica TaxID=1267423 RepID=A0A1I0MQ26_9BACT|nr:hypothetical protein [Roseivirga pacifica]RKQ50603.1 hypothetical protein BXY85_1619 [Roseivirga pacifica]SEV90658.1 hypothetical protein SAMN05216290_0603 [Roseivirga pacifica]
MTKNLSISLFEKFDELSANVIMEDLDAAKEFLAELKIDSEKVSLKGVNEINKALFLAKAKANQARDTSLLEKLRSKIKESIEHNATLAGEVLKNTLSERRASFQFRNLEKWSDDELREVLGDADIAKLLEDLEDLE